MKTARDLIALLLTVVLEVYIVLIAGRYYGYNQTLMIPWALAGLLGMLLTSRYYAWRH